MGRNADNRSHVLVIGGTGMLLKTSAWLAKQADTLSVVASTASSLSKLKNLNKKINLIEANYNSEDVFLLKINEAIKSFGPITCVISWVHSTAPNTPFKLAAKLLEHCAKLELYDILGSSHADPSDSKKLKDRQLKFNDLGLVRYNRIILGFVLEKNSSRWLTNDEISSGVIAAIQNNVSTTVGTTEPWGIRP